MRKLATDEGMIENGCGRSQSDARIPESFSARSIASPHLAHPEQAREFQTQVLEDATKADG
jgi:hypothetical protein